MTRRDEIPCVFQIPMQYNDGRPVEPEKMHLYQTVLTRQFHGYTPLGKIPGGNWYGKVESAERFEVWVTRERVVDLERVVKLIGRDLGQKEMFLIVPDASVIRFDMDEEEVDDGPGLNELATGN